MAESTDNMFVTTTALTKPYFDSSVFIAHIKGEIIRCPDGSTRVDTTTHLFEDAQAGKYKIYTSFVTLAEVRRVRHRTTQITEDERMKINGFFAEFFQHEWIYPIEVNRDIAEKAQSLGATYGLDAMDSIHLATAIWYKCPVLFVWDRATFTSKIPSVVEGVRIEEPHWEGIPQMPTTL
jgi:predicted nucleic acid-binding protein